MNAGVPLRVPVPHTPSVRPARAARLRLLALGCVLVACGGGAGQATPPCADVCQTSGTDSGTGGVTSRGGTSEDPASVPALRISPPPGTRLLPGQRFDLRVEGSGIGPFSATLHVNGELVALTSGGQGTRETDGITGEGCGGFDRRGFSLDQPGIYDLEATFTDDHGTGTATSWVEVVDPATLAGGGRVRNLILLLGDGMGQGHRTAARIALTGAMDPEPVAGLAMDRMPATGTAATRSRNSAVTDSAAGMTSYSIGNRVDNADVGVFAAQVTNPFFAPRVENLASYLHRTRGMVTGVVTTADITDATPAATTIHVSDRLAGTGIADQILDEAAAEGVGGLGLRVLLGGGRRWMIPAGQEGSWRSDATDYPGLPADLAAAWGATGTGAIDPGRDLLADFQARGFSIVSSAAELAAAAATPPARLLGSFASGHLTPALDRLAQRRAEGDGEPMLDEMTRAALAVLAAGDQGFFLMVEGAHVDKDSHGQDAGRAVLDVLDFDRAVEVALEFARRDGRTLVVALADHETGGLTIADASAGGTGILRYAAGPDGYPQRVELDGAAASTGYDMTWTDPGQHTGADVPISAYAVDERDWQPFEGPHQNADLFFDMAAVLQAD